MSVSTANISGKVTLRRTALISRVLLLFIGSLGSIPAAAADDFDEIVKHGVELRTQGRDREALAEFERARALKDTPRVIAQIGLAEFALGLWLPAAEHIEAALKQDRDPWIKKNHDALAKAAAGIANHLGTAEIWGGPPGAEGFLNGKRVGTLPSAPITRVVAGACTVLVTAPGFEDLTRTIRVEPKQLFRENVQLVARRVVLDTSAVAPARKLEPQPLVNAPVSSTQTTTSAPAAEPDKTSSSILGSPWFWVAVGVAIAGGTTAALLLSRSGSRCSGDTVCPQ